MNRQPVVKDSNIIKLKIVRILKFFMFPVNLLKIIELALLIYTQKLYRFFHSSLCSTSTIIEAVQLNCNNKGIFRVGIFSLLLIFKLGIFFGVPANAIQTIPKEISANQTYNATFSFDIEEFAPRTNIVPDRIKFNASGTLNTYNDIPAYSPGDFSNPWHLSYPTNSWETVNTESFATQFYYDLQAGQISADSSPNLNPGDIVLSRMEMVSGQGNIEFIRYSSEDNFLTTTSTGPFPVKNGSAFKSHAMIITKTKIYFFWVDASDNKIHMRSHNGTEFSDEITFSSNDNRTTYGLGGGLINRSGTEYVALVYAKSDTEINLVTFPDGDFSSSSIATQTITVSNFSTPHADICQNPRTGYVYLTWVDVDTQYYLKSDSPDNFVFSSAPTALVSDKSDTSFGFSIQGFPNFETDFALPSDGNTYVSNIVLKNPDVAAGNISPKGHAQIFSYGENNKNYAGLVTLSGFQNFKFSRRLLDYPDEFSWDKSNKVLHLEGPPIKDSKVIVEVDFAEINEPGCIGQTINTAGGSSSFINKNNLIASAGNILTLAFDKDMNLASSLINNKIKLLAPDNSELNISYNSLTSRTISFSPDNDLDFATSYNITIASDVLDANGSQIYQDYSLNFTTQNSVSNVIASEVSDIQTFSDAAYSNELADGTEINATTTIYLQIQATDPAYNTVDTATASILLNGTQIDELVLTQTAANSNFFGGSYSLNAPYGGNNLYEFISPAPAIKTSLIVNYPTLSSVNPSAGSTNVGIDTNPQLVFSESIDAATLNKENIKLIRDGTAADYSLSLSGNTITINPDDSSESYLLTETTYEIQAGAGLTDLSGNPFVNTPATFTSTFTTQASRTRPLSVSSLKIFSDADFSSELAAKSDYAKDATIYLQISGTDGSTLTKDYALAQASTGDQITLYETASSTAVYQGSFTYAGLSDNYELIINSNKTPSASSSLVITYPEISPVYPASGATDIPVNSSIRVQADEQIKAAEINTTTVQLLKAGAPVAASRSYNSTTREITITPDALLESETTYRVKVEGLHDVYDNPQSSILIYEFSSEDIIPPTISSYKPGQNETGVTIDRKAIITFSEEIMPSSINKTNITVKRNGANAGYNLILNSDKLTIDPDDTTESYWLTDTSYEIAIGPGVKDLAGNNLSSSFTLNFSTQPSTTAPASLDSLTIYKDALLLESWTAEEQAPANTTVYVKLTGTDGATQTKDIATVTLDLSWTAGNPEFYLNETASNSTGFYIGSFDLGSIPIYGFPNPQPPVNSGKITFLANQNSTRAATLTISFPQLLAGQTKVQNINGSVTADGATDVRVDTDVTTAFSYDLANAGDANSFKVASGGSAISGTRTLSADGAQLIFTPDVQLPYSSKITITAPYSASGLESPQGNPLYRDFSYSFYTQNSTTQPSSIDQVNLFADSSYSATSAYDSNDDFPGSGIVYIEFKATDASANTIDQTIADSTTGDSINLIETGADTGIFRGSLNYTSLSDNFVLRISSSQQPTASQTLKLTYPKLSQNTPASGATDISVSTPVYVRANEELDQTTVTAANVKLLAADNTEIACEVDWNNDLKQIELTPQSPLSYSSEYFIKIANIKDPADNSLQNIFISSFKTQATSIEPTNITSLKAFSDSGFTSQIPDNGTRPPGSTCYFELQAVDNSSSSIDSTNLRMISDISASTVQIKLIETGKNTGVFTGSKTLFDEENATLTITSEVDTNYSTRIKTLGFPTYSSFQPASGSTGIYLDTRFKIKANKPFDATSISTSSIRLSDSTGIVSFTPVLSAADEITIYSQLAKNSPVFLNLKDTVKDSDGMNFPATTAEFQSINPSYTDLRLFADSARTELINSGSNVEVGQTIYARVTGTDAYYYKNETVHLICSTANATQTVDLNENSAGIFEASFLIPDEPEQQLYISLVENSGMNQQLYIMPAFSLTSFSPASGAVSVAADTWPTWNFTRPVDSSYANANYFKVIKVSDGSSVNGIFTQSPSNKQVRFQPDDLFELLTRYEMSVLATVEDESGNMLGSRVTTSFTTQPPPPPPSIISSFANYETDAYATATTSVAKNGTLYIKMTADDVSFSTYETARVRIDSSDGTYDGEEMIMIEVSPPSGVFTLELPINLPLGTQITITPQVAANKAINVTAYNRTRLLSVSPASGSTDLYLDHPLHLNFSQAIDSNSISNGLTIVSENAGPIKYLHTAANSGKTIDITPSSGYATGSSHILAISSNLKDINGLFLLPKKIAFSTKGENQAEFDIKTGLPPLDNQLVSKTGEVIAQNNLIVATTTNLFETKPEFRTLNISSTEQNSSLKLVEQAPGFFIATFTPGTGFSESPITAKLDFATQPELSFNLATLPVLLSTYPEKDATKVEEYPTLSASFSRLIAATTGENGATVSVPSGSIETLLLNASDSTQLSWQLKQTLPLQASCSFILTGLTDYLGQPFAKTQIDFSTGGLQGINLYKDTSYSLRIASETIESSIAYVEVAASSTLAPQLDEFYLHARTGTKATTTYRLPLQRLASDSGRFRCSLELSPVKNQPQYQLPMYPGEWLELSSPKLTDNRKIYYFRQSGTASPKNIKDIKFYAEKHYAQPVNDVLPVPSLFIEIEAEDLNWFTSDTTFVKVTSDADPTGFRLKLKEAGTHSGLFRGSIKIDNNSSHINTKRLLVQPDQRIFVQSLTDASVEKWIKYLPTNGLRMVSTFPNPVRGNFMYFRFYLNFPGIVEIEIYDTSGYQVSSRFIRGFQGENKFKWRVPGNLANGVYFYVIKLNDSSPYPDTRRKAKGKFAVLR